MSATHRVNERKCATCSFWGGNREIQLRQRKPFYVVVPSGSFGCTVNKSWRKRGGDTCLGWNLWEKL